MKRKRGAPKALTDVANAVFLVPEAEAEKQEQEPEDPRTAEWNAFAQDHYERRSIVSVFRGSQLTLYAVVEQLPLSLHRSFSLLRELDDLAQGTSPLPISYPAAGRPADE